MSHVYKTHTKQDDAEFVQDCVTRNGLALEYISKRLKMNMMIVETAIKQNPNALVYAAPDGTTNHPCISLFTHSHPHTPKHTRAREGVRSSWLWILSFSVSPDT